jgi:hypothetical protein
MLQTVSVFPTTNHIPQPLAHPTSFCENILGPVDIRATQNIPQNLPCCALAQYG